MAGSRARLDWVNIAFLLFVHGVAIGGTVLYLNSHGATLAAMAVTAVWLFACGFSVTAGYHRLFAHGSYQAHWILRSLFLFFGAGAFENSALKWAADHRLHHRFVDEEQDPYNIRRGFWWAHIGWVLFKDPQSEARAQVEDLGRDPLVRLQHRFYVPIAVLSGFILPAVAGLALGDLWGGLILGGFARLVFLYHCTFCVNSLAHTLGRQPYSDASSARDSAITAVITLGEGYHNFHHTFSFDYRNGVRAAQFDPTKWLIRALSFVGLAKELVRAPYEAIVRARLVMQERRAKARLKDEPRAAERLRARRERLESLLERWAALKRELAEMKARTGNRSREMLAALSLRIREARAQFREAYKAWFRMIRQPECLLLEA